MVVNHRAHQQMMKKDSAAMVVLGEGPAGRKFAQQNIAKNLAPFNDSAESDSWTSGDDHFIKHPISFNCMMQSSELDLSKIVYHKILLTGQLVPQKLAWLSSSASKTLTIRISPVR